MSSIKQYRYPGSRAFKDNDIDRGLFFGRELEKSSFLYKVLAEDLVVLYSKSGLGKTSLINVGVNQELRDRGYLPIIVNFNDPEGDPMERFYQGIEDYAETNKIDYKPGNRDSMWHYFKTAEFWSAHVTLLKPVLVLDQFEDFFTSYGPGSRELFFRQLAALNNDIMPDGLAEIPGGRFHRQYKPPAVKIIISIREDYLGQMDEMSQFIPDILHNRFRLSALTRDQAKEAITEPAKIESDVYSVPKFGYADKTVTAILDFLCEKRKQGGVKFKDEVESFQLQLLCRDIEEKIWRKFDGKFDPGGKNIVVGPRDLGGKAGMEAVLERFYDNQINQIGSAADRKNIRKLFEKGLISQSDRRLPMEEEQIQSTYKVSKKSLAALVDCHLLRSEPRFNSTFYQLSHDTMISPIRESQKKRRADKMKRWWIACAAGILVVVAAAFFLLSHQLTTTDQRMEEARKLKNEGKSLEAAEVYSEIISGDKTFFDAYMELGEMYYQLRKFDEAIKNYEEARDNGMNNAEIFLRLGRAFSAKFNPMGENKHTGSAADSGGSLKEGDYSNVTFYHEAIKNYDIAGKFKGKKREAFLGLARLYIKSNKLDILVDLYQNIPANECKLLDIYKEIHEALQAKEDYKEERDGYIKRIYDLASAQEGCKELYYLNLGSGCAQISDYNGAIANYRKAIELNPGFSTAYVKLGDLYYWLEDYDEAAINYKIAIEKDPGNIYAYNGLGIIFSRDGRYDEAITWFEKAIEIKPGYLTYYNMGNAFYYQGKYAEAIENYRKAIEINPGHLNSYINKGQASFENKEYESGTAAYKKALEIIPDDLDTQTDVAFGYLLCKKFQEAVKMADNLVEKNTSVGNKCTAIFVSISALLFLDNKPEAISRYKKYSEFLQGIVQDLKGDWRFSTARDFIKDNTKPSEPESIILLALIDVIESDQTDRGNKIQTLEAVVRGITQ